MLASFLISTRQQQRQNGDELFFRLNVHVFSMTHRRNRRSLHVRRNTSHVDNRNSAEKRSKQNESSYRQRNKVAQFTFQLRTVQLSITGSCSILLHRNLAKLQFWMKHDQKVVPSTPTAHQPGARFRSRNLSAWSTDSARKQIFLSRVADELSFWSVQAFFEASELEILHLGNSQSRFAPFGALTKQSIID